MTRQPAQATPAIATPETDAKLRAEYRQKGFQARQDGVRATRDRRAA